jgi:glycosyltransferase involved in cell wall biosynthesis
MLADALSALPDVDLRYFSWRGALLSRYDAFHAHWPEILVDGHGPAKTLARQCLSTLFFARLQLGRVGVVRTVHNVELPSGLSRRQRALLQWFDRITVLRIRINETTELPAGQEFVTIPHGHYRDWFARYPRESRMPHRLAYVGSIRRYKSVDSLLAAFEGTRDTSPALTLTLSGKPSTPELESMVTDAVARDARITAVLAFVDDAQLVAEVTAAEVVVLPYRHMHNSGGVLAALSLDRPVLVPDNEANAALAAEVGQEWVQRFDGELTADHLTAALEAVRDLDPTGRPDLSRRGWDSTAADHLDAYRRACALRRGTA